MKTQTATKVKFRAGPNIAMKVPPHQYEATVRFYRDVLGFARIESEAPHSVFEFGDKQLWIDRVSGVSQAEIWLQVQTNDIGCATEYLAEAGVVRCDEIETLPEGFAGCWISSPAAVIHLVSENKTAVS
ncbi:MAG: hypothetical protein RIF32_01785 [Leptospirales bacterium]|jgi:catechol 2,3-dioxygenase-like lactoylglutathione lyase family enzyme